MRSRHVPSFWHGLEAHSLTSCSQRGPAYPRTQLQVKEPSVFTHWPPCSQGLVPEDEQERVWKLNWCFTCTDASEAFCLLSYQCCIRLGRCCRCCPYNQVDSYSWTFHWWGWCRNASPLYRDYWYRHRLCGTANLDKGICWQLVSEKNSRFNKGFTS